MVGADPLLKKKRKFDYNLENDALHIAPLFVALQIPFHWSWFVTNPMPSFSGTVEQPSFMYGNVHSQPEHTIQWNLRYG